jgi:hypothetical protein
MHTTHAGSVVTRTVLFHTYYSCTRTVIGSCTHNHTTYSVFSQGNQHTCFNPTYYPREQWLKVRSFHSAGDLINHTRVSDPNKPVSIYFDVSATTAKSPSTWVRMGSNCGNLAWEKTRTYRLDDKYMHLETTSWVSSCASYEEIYCPY